MTRPTNPRKPASERSWRIPAVAAALLLVAAPAAALGISLSLDVDGSVDAPDAQAVSRMDAQASAAAPLAADSSPYTAQTQVDAQAALPDASQAAAYAAANASDAIDAAHSQIEAGMSQAEAQAYAGASEAQAELRAASEVPLPRACDAVPPLPVQLGAIDAAGSATSALGPLQGSADLGAAADASAVTDPALDQACALQDDAMDAKAEATAEIDGATSPEDKQTGVFAKIGTAFGELWAGVKGIF